MAMKKRIISFVTIMPLTKGPVTFILCFERRSAEVSVWLFRTPRIGNNAFNERAFTDKAGGSKELAT
jgi:uncharacterized membrane protein YbaN (DUF454 family)